MPRLHLKIFEMNKMLLNFWKLICLLPWLRPVSLRNFRFKHRLRLKYEIFLDYCSKKLSFYFIDETADRVDCKNVCEKYSSILFSLIGENAWCIIGLFLYAFFYLWIGLISCVVFGNFLKFLWFWGLCFQTALTFDVCDVHTPFCIRSSKLTLCLLKSSTTASFFTYCSKCTFSFYSTQGLHTLW